MATINITVPDPVLPRILAAITARYGYNALVDGTQAQFVNKQIKLWLRSEVFAFEALTAAQTTNTALTTNLETELPVP